MELVRSEQEVDEQLNKAADGMDAGTVYPGMSYEEGVSQMGLWLTGQSSDPPL